MNKYRFHMKKHKEDEMGPEGLKCKKCDHIANNYTNLRVHDCMEHKVGYMICTQCNHCLLQSSYDVRNAKLYTKILRVNYVRIIKEHCKKWHASDVCEICGYTAKNRANYYEHINNSHKVIKCEHCGIDIIGEKR